MLFCRWVKGCAPQADKAKLDLLSECCEMTSSVILFSSCSHEAALRMQCSKKSIALLAACRRTSADRQNNQSSLTLHGDCHIIRLAMCERTAIECTYIFLLHQVPGQDSKRNHLMHLQA